MGVVEFFDEPFMAYFWTRFHGIMRKQNYLLISLFFLTVCTATAQDIFAPMKDALKAGNSKELVKTFNTSVDMNLDGDVKTYSKAQAEFVLKDFFKKHAVTDFSIVHTGSSKGGLQFAIGRYASNNESYNVLIRVKEVEGVFLVHEINFVRE
jgi:Domain of unknown function (DUF4783)